MKNALIKKYGFSMEELDIHATDVRKTAKMGEEMAMYDDFIESEIVGLKNIGSIKGALAFISDFTLDKGKIILDNTVFDAGKQITFDLKGSTQGVLFLCTAGKEVSLRSKELMTNGNLLEGYLVDVLGSIMVENAMDLIQKKLRSIYRSQNLECTNRYSPGYCDWTVGEQHKLFSFFPKGTCDISLTDSSLMFPIKSISGIIGIGEQAKYNKYRCDICKSKTCIYRQVRSNSPV